ncbi:catecholate siderophore receptor [Methylobacillus rhizosphaerae]|uniref:Catecholate siderophore receptor n=1 Tax=Methylobacillus rhizosphaerae TaxID=551994 RepID=A0A238XXQ2_9PROT|nr:TonB-dependent siderophore receptor [Methylobacillus rhizosphaerae]SNR63203.1 catecholate siderophore receptor [Methylobacillus rhizosphaerae]
MNNCKCDVALKPAAAAVALLFAGVAVADETTTLPELQVESKKENPYKVEKSANQKFTAPLKDTPKSVTIISESLIQDTGSNTFQDALRTAPGITFGTGEGGGPIGDRPFIRGFDAQSAIFVDGLRDIGAQQREVFAIEQLEVLKGPSGAFDGRGSAGGSINVVTKRAKAGNFTSGSIGIGTDSYRRATFDGNYMIGDDAAIRLVGVVHDADTPGRDGVDVKRWGFMPSLTIGLNGPTSATVSWYHFETDDMPDRGLMYRDNSGNTKSRPMGVSKDNFYGLKDRDYHETTADIGTFEFKHAFSDDVTLRNTMRYGETRNEYVATRSLPNAANVAADIAPRSGQARKTKTTSLMNLTDLSVAFETGSIKHTVNTGFEISREETDSYTATWFGDGATGPDTSLSNPNPNDPWNGYVSFSNAPNNTWTSRSKSAYVFDSIELNDKWLVNAGVRYDRFEVENNTARSDHSFWNYQLGAVYKVQPNGSIYASYGTSSTPVGLGNGDANHENGNNGIADDLSPERTKNFEVGTKWDVLDGLSLTAAAFYTQKSNARVLMATGAYANAGEFDVKGIELGAAGKITDKWDVFAGYTHLDSEQSKTGDAFGGHRDLGGAANKGKDMPGVAKNSASVWTTYKVLPQLTVGGGAFYMDKVYADPGNMLYVPSYVRWDAMANYKIDDRISLQLNLQNLTDKRYFNQTYTRHFATVAPGRLAFVSLNFKF